MLKRLALAFSLLLLALGCVAIFSSRDHTAWAATELKLDPETGTATAGQEFEVTVTAFPGPDAGYRGRVQFSSSDSAAALPDEYFFTEGDAGVHTFEVTLRTQGPQWLRVDDPESGGSLWALASRSVEPAGATRLEITGLDTMDAGGTRELTITAKDEFGNTATGYTGTKQLTFSGPGTIGTHTPTVNGVDIGTQTAVTFSSGQSVANLVAYKAETAIVNVTGGSIDSFASPAYNITVNPGAAASLDLTPNGGPADSGTAFDVTVTAYDTYGNVATGYSGTVEFTSSDTQAELPDDYDFDSGDDGVHTFTDGVTLRTSGSQTVTVADGGMTNTETWIVSSTGAASLIMTPNSGSAAAGAPFTFTITAQDAFGDVVTDYDGTVHFASSDTGAGVVLPANYTFSTGDSGEHVFSVTLITPGSQTVTVTDIDDALDLIVTGTWNVAAGAAASLAITPEGGSATAGTAFNVTVTARDAYGAIATGYTGTIQFSSTDSSSPTLPAAYTFTVADGGVHVFTAGVILNTAGGIDVTVTDTANAALTDTESWTVAAGPVASIVLSPDNTVVKTGNTVTYKAESVDQWNNVIADVTGSTTFDIDDAAGGSWSGSAYTSAKIGHWTVTATYATFTKTTELEVMSGTIVRIEITPASYSIEAGAKQSYEVAAYDAAENEFYVTSSTVFTTSGDHGGSWKANTYTSAKTGTWTITATWTVTGTSTKLTATAVLTVTASEAGIDHYHVESASYTQKAGMPFSLIVTAHDKYNNVVMTGTVSVTLSSSSARVLFDANGDNVFDDATMTLTNGAFSITAKGTVAASGITIIATDTNKKTGTSSSTYTFAPDSANRAPEGIGDSYSVEQNGTLTIAAPGVLSNDTDKDGDELMAVLVGSVTHGTLTFNSDGSFTYSPNSDFIGTDSFTYRANDTKADSANFVVTINVGKGKVAIGSGMSTWFWVGLVSLGVLLASVLFIVSGRRVRRPDAV